MFNAGTIQGGLKFDMSEYTHAILQAQSISSIFPGIVTSFLENPLLGFIDTIKQVGSALVELAFKFSETQRRTAQLADSLGVDLEFLDGWGKAATLVGGNVDMVAEIMVHLSHAANMAATQGGSTADAFKALGVTIKDGGGHLKPMDELLQSVSDGLAKMGAGAQRTGIAMEVLGRGGASTLAFLGQGSEKINSFAFRLQEMGLIATQATAKAAQAFEELWGTVQLAWNGILAKIAEPVRTALMPILEDLLKWMETHPDEIKAAIESMAESIRSAFKIIREVVEFAIGHFNQIIQVMGAAGIGAAALIAVQALGLIQGAFAALIPQIIAATAAQAAFNAAASGLRGAGIGGAIGAVFGDGPEATLGGGIGGGIGGIAGGLLGGPVGAYVGSVAGGAIGTAIGSQFASPPINVDVKIDASATPDELARAAVQAATPVISEKIKKQAHEHLQQQRVSGTLKGNR